MIYDCQQIVFHIILSKLKAKSYIKYTNFTVKNDVFIKVSLC